MAGYTVKNLEPSDFELGYPSFTAPPPREPTTTPAGSKP